MKNVALNQVLYDVLKARFGNVRISNQGVAQVSQYGRRINPGRDKRSDNWYLNLVEPGEYYQVCCPYCNDTRFRLYFNHRWGRKDPDGNRNLWMAICYNENCLSSYDRRQRLYDEMTDRTCTHLERAPISKGIAIDPSKIVMEWPGPVTRVDKLPENHKAVQYLLSRNFDPVRIGRFYNVHYCHDSFRWLARDRLIIPIYEEKVLKGWQARYIGEINWKRKNAQPKYYTCPGTPRRYVIYNLANAACYRTGVIVEGPTDVWSLGPMACCTLGATMTPQQRLKFHRHFREHTAILLYDADAWDKPGTKKIVEAFTGKFAGGFAAIKLPKGRDPGNMDREFLREFIVAKAAKQGVHVSWSKRKC